MPPVIAVNEAAANTGKPLAAPSRGPTQRRRTGPHEPTDGPKHAEPAASARQQRRLSSTTNRPTAPPFAMARAEDDPGRMTLSVCRRHAHGDGGTMLGSMPSAAMTAASKAIRTMARTSAISPQPG
jgi:hypothetical protein